MGLLEHLTEAIAQPLIGFREQVPVTIEGKAHGGVTRPGGDLLRIRPGGDPQGDSGVPEIVGTEWSFVGDGVFDEPALAGLAPLGSIKGVW